MLSEVLAVADRLWPQAGAEPWDAPGLVTGDPARPVERVLMVVDVVADTVSEAVADGYDLVIAHHPLLLRGVTSVAEDRYKGALLARLIRSDCAVLTAHTNADIVHDGVSDVLARALGLVELAPIVASAADAAVGIGRVGVLREPTTLGRFARAVADVLPATASGVRVAGEYDRAVSRVSLCGGAGDAYLRAEAVLASDVYVTSDLRHHPASEAREQALLGAGPALIDVSHWAAEWLWLHGAAARLGAELPGLSVTVSERRTDPWDFAIVH